MWAIHVDYIIRSHDQKGHVVPHINCLYPRNAVVLLTMLLASHNADVSPSGVT